jgi:toxin ParE2
VTFRILTVAEAELDDAVNWYDTISLDLGNAFLNEAARVFSLIEQYPDAWHPIGQNIRRCRLMRFPYGVIYASEGTDQLIIALAHLHRGPLYWRDRLKLS